MEDMTYQNIDVLDRIKPELSQLGIEYTMYDSPGLAVFDQKLQKTRPIITMGMKYKNVFIGEFRFYKDTNEGGFRFMTKLGIRKRVPDYSLHHIVPTSDNDSDLVSNYVVGLTKSHISGKVSPGYYWQYKVHNDANLIQTLANLVRYVDYELEPDPSKANGWNLMCRLRCWHKRVKQKLSNRQCVARIDYAKYDELYKGKEFTLENGNIALMDFCPHTRCELKTYVVKVKAEPSNPFKDIYYVVETFKNKVVSYPLKLDHREAMMVYDLFNK